MTRTSLTAIAVVALALPACGGSGDAGGAPTAPTASTTAVTIENFSFTVDGIAAVDGTVVITNSDGVAHTWTANDGTFDSGAISPGGTFDFTFAEPGEHSFFCSIHPSMTGTITVTG